MKIKIYLSVNGKPFVKDQRNKEQTSKFEQNNVMTQQHKLYEFRCLTQSKSIV